MSDWYRKWNEHQFGKESSNRAQRSIENASSYNTYYEQTIQNKNKFESGKIQNTRINSSIQFAKRKYKKKEIV